LLDELLRHGGGVFFAATYGSLLIVAAAERALERRRPVHSAVRRWSSNFALGFVDRSLVRGLLPLGAISLALWSTNQQLGLLHALPLSPLPALLITVGLLDLAAYAVHRLEHAVPLLWRLHRVHHADLELDFSTAERHHPLSAIFTNGVQLLVVAAIGASPAGVVGYFLMRGPIDAFSHGNLRIPQRIDRGLRWLLITPGMHAVHHSAAREETDTNFGELFSLWDHLFGSYQEAPVRGYQQMRIGLEDFRSPRDLDVDRLLLQPFRNERRSVPALA